MSDVLYVTTVVTPLVVLFIYVSLETFSLQRLTLTLTAGISGTQNKLNALFEGRFKEKEREPYLEISGTLYFDRSPSRSLGVFPLIRTLDIFHRRTTRCHSISSILVCQRESRGMRRKEARKKKQATSKQANKQL
jgi:hypothetical protein